MRFENLGLAEKAEETVGGCKLGRAAQAPGGEALNMPKKSLRCPPKVFWHATKQLMFGGKSSRFVTKHDMFRGELGRYEFKHLMFGDRSSRFATKHLARVRKRDDLL